MLEFSQDNDALTGKIIGCAMEVPRMLGPGLLESSCESAPAIEMTDAGLRFDRQMVGPVAYKSRAIGEHRLDFLDEGEVILELKSVERFDPVFEAQLLTYLRLTGKHRGLLIKFNSRLLKGGIRRYVL